jgi:MFS family permease
MIQDADRVQLVSGASAMRVRADLAVAVTFFAHGLLFASWTAHIPHVKARLGVTDGTLGVALLGAPIGSACAMWAAGYLLPRIGSRRLVRVALTGYCAAGPFVGLAGSVPALFAALLFWGAFMGGLDTSMNTQALTVEHARGRPLMNGMHAGWGLGAFAGGGVGSLGVAVGLSLSRQLLILGAALLLVVGWLSTGMLADAPHERPPGAARQGRRVPAAMVLLGAVAFASMLCEGAAADWSSVYLRDSLGAAGAVTGLGFTGFALAMVLVRMFGNRLLARYPAVVLLPALAGAACVGFSAALLVGHVAAGVAAFFLLGLGVGTVVPTAFSVAGRLPGVHPGVGVATVSGFGTAGFVLGPPMIGQLADATSLPAALGTVPALLAVIALLTRRIGALPAPTAPAATLDTGAPAWPG